MTTTAHKKFEFGTVFDAAGGTAYAAPVQRRVYTAAEVDTIKAASYAAPTCLSDSADSSADASAASTIITPAFTTR